MTSERTDLTPIALGFCITAAGVLLLLYNLGLFDAVQVVKLWPVALVLVGGAMMWSSMHGVRSNVSFGAIVWIIILGLVFNYAFARRQSAEHPAPADHVNLFAVLGGDKRPPITGHFGGAKITSVWGGTQLDLRQAQLGPGEEVVIDVFTMMAGGTIRVPADWQVDIEAVAVAGGINNRVSNRKGAEPSEGTADAAKETSPVGPPPRVVIRGAVIMGGLSVRP